MAFMSRSASVQSPGAALPALSWNVCSLDPSCSCRSKAAVAIRAPCGMSSWALLSVKHPTPPAQTYVGACSQEQRSRGCNLDMQAS